jgi:hypothetical protein
MKAKFLSLLAAATLLFACGTTSYTSTSGNAAYSTPANLQSSFSTQYPTASNVTWGAYDAATVPIDWELSGWAPMDATGHTATFDMDGQRYYAWYDANGTWVGSTFTVSDHSKLPSTVQTLIKDKYGDYTIEKVDQEMWKDKVAYEVKLKKDNAKVKLLVDNEGNVIKEKMKTD